MPVLAPSWNSACTPEPADADGVKSAIAQFTPATDAVCSESARIPATELAGRCRADTYAWTSVPVPTSGPLAGVAAAAPGAPIRPAPSATDGSVPASMTVRVRADLARTRRVRARKTLNCVTVLSPRRYRHVILAAKPRRTRATGGSEKKSVCHCGAQTCAKCGNTRAPFPDAPMISRARPGWACHSQEM